MLTLKISLKKSVWLALAIMAMTVALMGKPTDAAAASEKTIMSYPSCPPAERSDAKTGMHKHEREPGMKVAF